MIFKQLRDARPEVFWRVQSVSTVKPIATCVAYITARSVQDVLDNIIGADKWQSKFMVINNNLFCGIGIKVRDEWIWKWDTGTEGNIEKEKSSVSDSFKRAAVQWGVGRFLYNLKVKFVKTNVAGKKGYPIDDNGKRIFDLTEYFKNNAGNIEKKQKIEDDDDSNIKLLSDAQIKQLERFLKSHIFSEKEKKGIAEMVAGKVNDKKILKTKMDYLFNKEKIVRWLEERDITMKQLESPDMTKKDIGEKLRSDFINDYTPKTLKELKATFGLDIKNDKVVVVK